MTESQLSICTWADATFGPASDASIAARALVEMAELVTACVNGEPAERIGEEVADVVIVLARLGRALNINAIANASIPWSGSTRPADVACADAAVLLSKACSSLVGGPVRKACNHAILCIVSLAEVAATLRVNIPAAIDRKMAINRARRWTLDGHGHGWHVKEPADV